MENKKIAIILNTPEEIENVLENDVILVDGGARFIKKLNNKNIVCVIGDFDSLENSYKQEIDKQQIVGLEKEKNYSDGEFALRYAIENGYKNISIYGATGGRIDHVLCNISLLKKAKDLEATAKIIDKNEEMFLTQNYTKIIVKKGTTLSILPFYEECLIDNSKGLYYPLNNLTLTKSDSRGLSNIARDSEVSFDVKKGIALVIINK